MLGFNSEPWLSRYAWLGVIMSEYSGPSSNLFSVRFTLYEQKLS